MVRTIIISCIFMLSLKLNVDATFIKCGGTSSHRTLTFKNPDKIPETCVYKFKKPSSRVCKIKFVFNQFSLAQPILLPYPKCVTDELEVNGISLCGENPGQHIFVTYPESKVITMTIRSKDRNGIGIPPPKWNIKMTQMDCDENNIALAPPLCDQYFDAPKGVIESFNYRYGVGPYIGNTSYSICIRKPDHDKSIRITSTIFEMSFINNNGLDTDCLSTIEISDLSEDYLYIPGAKIEKNNVEIRADKFCGTSLIESIVTSKTPGPFVMYFNSDLLYENAKPETGFSLFYEIF